MNTCKLNTTVLNNQKIYEHVQIKYHSPEQPKKSMNTCKLNTTLLNNQSIKEEIKGKFKSFSRHENENTRIRTCGF